MAAGQIYDNGFGGANKRPLGAAGLDGGEYPTKLANLASPEQKGSNDTPRGPVRKFLAAIGIHSASAAQPGIHEQVIVHGAVEAAPAVMPDSIQQAPGVAVDPNTQIGAQEVPSSPHAPTDPVNRV